MLWFVIPLIASALLGTRIREFALSAVVTTWQTVSAPTASFFWPSIAAPPASSSPAVHYFSGGCDTSLLFASDASLSCPAPELMTIFTSPVEATMPQVTALAAPVEFTYSTDVIVWAPAAESTINLGFISGCIGLALVFALVVYLAFCLVVFAIEDAVDVLGHTINFPFIWLITRPFTWFIIWPLSNVFTPAFTQVFTPAFDRTTAGIVSWMTIARTWWHIDRIHFVRTALENTAHPSVRGKSMLDYLTSQHNATAKASELSLLRLLLDDIANLTRRLQRLGTRHKAAKAVHDKFAKTSNANLNKANKNIDRLEKGLADLKQANSEPDQILEATIRGLEYALSNREYDHVRDVCDFEEQLEEQQKLQRKGQPTESDNRVLRGTISNLERNLETARQDVKTQGALVVTSQSLNANAHKKILEAHQKMQAVESLERTIASLKKDIEDAPSTYKTTVEEMQRTIDGLRKEVSDGQSSQKTANEESKRTVAGLKKKIEDGQNSQKTITEQMQGTITSLKSDIKVGQSSLKTATESIASLQVTIQEDQGSYKTATDTITSLQNEIQQGQNSHKDATDTITSLENEIKNGQSSHKTAIEKVVADTKQALAEQIADLEARLSMVHGSQKYSPTAGSLPQDQHRDHGEHSEDQEMADDDSESEPLSSATGPQISSMPDAPPAQDAQHDQRDAAAQQDFDFGAYMAALGPADDDNGIPCSFFGCPMNFSDWDEMCAHVHQYHSVPHGTNACTCNTCLELTLSSAPMPPNQTPAPPSLSQAQPATSGEVTSGGPLSSASQTSNASATQPTMDQAGLFSQPSRFDFGSMTGVKAGGGKAGGGSLSSTLQASGNVVLVQTASGPFFVPAHKAISTGPLSSAPTAPDASATAVTTAQPASTSSGTSAGSNAANWDGGCARPECDWKFRTKLEMYTHCHREHKMTLVHDCQCEMCSWDIAKGPAPAPKPATRGQDDQKIMLTNAGNRQKAVPKSRRKQPPPSK